jgi:hypothetical protein
MIGKPLPGGQRRTFFQVVGRYFDQRKILFLIPDLERDLPFGVHITIAHARSHALPEVREWYNVVCRWFVRFENLMTPWRSQRDAVSTLRLVRHAGIREPREVRLGYTAKGHAGRAVGDGPLHRKLLEFFDKHPDILHDCTVEPDTLCMAAGFGTDRVSDVMVAVGKRPAIAFTQWCAAFYGFDPACLRLVTVRNVWDEQMGRFSDEQHVLPVDDDGHAILLVPSHIVRSGPPFSPAAYLRGVHGPDYSGPSGKRAVLEDAAANPGRLSQFAKDLLKDPSRYQIRRDLQAPKDDATRTRRKRK